MVTCGEDCVVQVWEFSPDLTLQPRLLFSTVATNKILTGVRFLASGAIAASAYDYDQLLLWRAV